MSVFAGVPVGTELHQLRGDAFEQQAFVEDEGVKPLFMAVTDKKPASPMPSLIEVMTFRESDR